MRYFSLLQCMCFFTNRFRYFLVTLIVSTRMNKDGGDDNLYFIHLALSRMIKTLNSARATCLQGDYY